MSLLSIVSNVSMEVGLGSVGQVIGTSDDTALQIAAFVQREGKELASSIDWVSLKWELVLEGDGSQTLWTLPSDFRSLFNGDALWSNQFQFVPLGGRVSDEEMIAIKNMPITPTRPVWRLWQGQVEIWPALASGEIVTTEYYSTNWIGTPGDATGRKARFTSDDDTPLLNEDLLELAGIWRWKRAQGIDYSEEFETYRNTRDRLAGYDRGPRTVHLSRGLRTNGLWGPFPVNPIVAT